MCCIRRCPRCQEQIGAFSASSVYSQEVLRAIHWMDEVRLPNSRENVQGGATAGLDQRSPHAVDTLDVSPLPGVVFKQFTARDVLSRWDVIQAHTRATAATAAQFLDTLQHRMPFPIRALQVDGGSEFAAEFEQACQQRGLHLFVLPPRSP